MATPPASHQRAYICVLIILQSLLMLAFGSTEITLFYVIFEATLIPTLIVITRWGNQKERLNAGNYFLFYTLAGSLPLLVALLFLYTKTGSLSILTLFASPPLLTDSVWAKL